LEGEFMKFSLSNTYASAMLICALLSPTLPAMASGNITHQVISDRAIGMIKNLQLSLLLKKNRDAYRTGVLHPDVADHGPASFATLDNIVHRDRPDSFGHIPSAFYPEKNWVSAYLELLRKGCGRQPNFAGCEKEVAYLFGAVSHMIEDARFDAHFAGLNSKDSNSPYYPKGIGIVQACPHIGFPGISLKNRYDLTTAFTDRDLDICLGKKIAQPNLVKIFKNTTYVNPRYAGKRSRNPARRCPGSHRYDFTRKACYKCPTNFKWTHKAFSKNIYAEPKACKFQALQCNKMANPGYTEIPMPEKIVVPNVVEKAYEQLGGKKFSSKNHKVATKAAATYYKSIRPKSSEGSFRTKGLVKSDEAYNAAYKDHQVIMSCSWAVANYVSKGINWTAGEVARFLDRLWVAMIPRDKPITISRPELRMLEVRKDGEFLFQSNN
jgi:hypothetical protein